MRTTRFTLATAWNTARWQAWPGAWQRQTLTSRWSLWTPIPTPTFISEYADEDLSTGKAMVQTERRHRVLTVTDLFTIEQDQTTGGYNTYSMVDSALAGALELVNMEDVPVFTIATATGRC